MSPPHEAFTLTLGAPSSAAAALAIVVTPPATTKAAAAPIATIFTMASLDLCQFRIVPQ